MKETTAATSRSGSIASRRRSPAWPKVLRRRQACRIRPISKSLSMIQPSPARCSATMSWRDTPRSAALLPLPRRRLDPPETPPRIDKTEQMPSGFERAGIVNGSQRSPDIRGSSHDRRARRAFLVVKFGSHSGKTLPCFHCGRRMHAQKHAWEVDRYPICGHDGGRYTRDNIVPSCSGCNATRCSPGSGPCRRKRMATIRPHNHRDYITYSEQAAVPF